MLLTPVSSVWPSSETTWWHPQSAPLKFKDHQLVFSLEVMTDLVEEQAKKLFRPMMLHQGKPIEVFTAFLSWKEDAFPDFLNSLKSKFSTCWCLILIYKYWLLCFLFAGILTTSKSKQKNLAPFVPPTRRKTPCLNLIIIASTSSLTPVD